MSLSLPGPWIDPEFREPAPWGNNDGIIKFIEFPVRSPLMSRRSFHLYWRRHHSPHVMNITSFSQYMRKYITGHKHPDAVPGLPEDFRQSTPFDGVSEVWINGLSEMGDWLGHPLYAELIQPDEKRFLLQDGSIEFIIAKEELVYAPQPDLNENGLTKLYMLLRRREDLGHDAFHSALSGYANAMAAQPNLRSIVRKLVVSHRLREPWPEGVSLANIDAVVELSFERTSDIESLFADHSYLTAIAPRERLLVDTGSIRVLAARMHVVHDEFSFQPSTMQPFGFTWSD